MTAFDYVLSISDQTAGTVTLTSAPWQVKEYAPRTGNSDEPTVSETIEVRLRDGSPANNLDELRTLQDLLRQARDARDNKSLDKVYLVWKENASADEWRSEIVDARAEWRDDALGYAHWTNDTQFANVYLERKNYWEGAEAQVPLTNPNASSTTDALPVYNCNDGAAAGGDTRYNYADIAGTAISGDMPGATRLELINTYASETRFLSMVWVGQNYTDPTNFDHFYEAEEATTSGTASASALGSGGTITTFTLYIANNEYTMLSWTITGAQLGAAAGRFYKAILRFSGAGDMTNVQFQVEVKSSTSVIWQSGWSQPSSDYAILIRDLLTFRLPPKGYGLSSLADLTLVLRGRAATVPANLYMDFLQITPVDGWRQLVAVNRSAVENERVIDDGINGELYIDNGSGSAQVPAFTGYGVPILLQPGKDQRLYFLMHTNYGNEAPLTMSLGVKLYYRPRRLSL